MSKQPLDLRRSLQIMRQHLTAIGIVAALGLLAGIGYAAFSLPMLVSNVLVVLPPSTNDMSAQVAIVSSEPVLASALRSIGPAMSLETLRSRVQVTSLTPYLLSISGEDRTDVQAEGIAKAVADSYVNYVGSPKYAGAPVQARVLESATHATGTRQSVRMLVIAVIGALLGALIGAIGVLAICRSDRRLRERDRMADAIGVPVLASLPVRHPTDAAGWTGLLEDYRPSTADARRLRNVLHYLGLANVDIRRCQHRRILSYDPLTFF